MVPAKDISRWNGTYTETSEPIVFCKISGGDDGLYFDSQAANNYAAITAAGHAFGGYHFAGGTDPVAEANKFVDGMKPLVTGEVPAVDIESGKNWNPNAPGVDPVAWTDQFIEGVRAASGNPNQGGLVYMNLATLLAHDWTPVLKKWGLWLADWNNNPAIDVNTDGVAYVMQQFSDGPVYDHDEWFGTIEEFKAYGWQTEIRVDAPQPESTTTTTTTTVPVESTTTSTTTVVPVPVEPDVPASTTTTTTIPLPDAPGTEPPDSTTTTTTQANGESQPVQGPSLISAIVAAIVAVVVTILKRLQGTQK
jgi:hypothetical protein